jgi:membrane protein DedA with SNARE-associated domain
MPITLVHFITTYGYWAIFWLIFLQEIGVPNPVSNELVLLFSGSLAFTGLLSFPLIFLTAVFADILGAAVLYIFFSFFRNAILSKRPTWIPVSEEQINKLRTPIQKHGGWAVFFGRLIPFARGYAAVAAGVFDLNAFVFSTSVIASALIWSGGFVTLGFKFGGYLTPVENTAGGVEKILIGAILITIIIITVRYLILKRRKKNIA